MLLWRTRRPPASTPEHTRAMNPTTADHRATPQPGPTSRDGGGALGLQLLGPVQGSGLRDPAYLVRRSDDQVVQLSELLHLVVVHADPPRPAAEVAAAVSASYGRTLTVEGLEHLVTTRLEPLGLVLPERVGGAGPAGARPTDPGADRQGDPAAGAVDAARRGGAQPAVLAAPRRGRPGRPGGRRRRAAQQWRLLAGPHRAVRHAHPGAGDLRPAHPGRGVPRVRSRDGLPLRRRRAG